MSAMAAEDPELAAALAMSMAEMQQDAGNAAAEPAEEPAAAAMDEEEDPELAAALAMSMASAEAEGDGAGAGAGEDPTAVLNNADFLADVMSGLDGVDVNDPAVQAALAGIDAEKAEDSDAKKGDGK